MTQLRHILRLILAASIALWLSHILQWGESYWLVIAALLSLQLSNAPLLRQKNSFLVVAAVCAALAAVGADCLSPHFALLALFLFFTTLSTVICGLRWPLFWGAAFLINFFAVLSAGLPTDRDGMTQRFVGILAGFGIAFALQKIFFPNRLRSDLRLSLTQALQDLMDLNQAIFNCFIAVDYPEKKFEYAKKVLQVSRHFSFTISVARELLKNLRKDTDKFTALLGSIELLYEITQALATLLYRVEDHTTFQIIQKELLALSDTLNKDLRAIKLVLLEKSKVLPSLETLQDNIYQLEDVNHAALSVAAVDPMVFLLFIQDLLALQTGMLQLNAAIVAAGRAA